MKPRAPKADNAGIASLKKSVLNELNLEGSRMINISATNITTRTMTAKMVKLLQVRE